MNTCSPAIVRISPLSIKLNVKMRPSVLLTVLKFLFSRVRKYFWLREMVDSWAESLRMDSSRTEVCSGEEPCLEGMMARTASFSTCEMFVSSLRGRIDFFRTYRNLKVDHLLGECAHLVVEAEAVLARVVRREDEVALSLFYAIENDLVCGSND